MFNPPFLGVKILVHTHTRTCYDCQLHPAGRYGTEAPKGRFRQVLVLDRSAAYIARDLFTAALTGATAFNVRGGADSINRTVRMLIQLRMNRLSHYVFTSSQRRINAALSTGISWSNRSRGNEGPFRSVTARSGTGSYVLERWPQRPPYAKRSQRSLHVVPERTDSGGD